MERRIYRVQDVAIDQSQYINLQTHLFAVNVVLWICMNKNKAD